jgi:hypothetical protein
MKIGKFVHKMSARIGRFILYQIQPLQGQPNLCFDHIYILLFSGNIVVLLDTDTSKI